jgi:hypothetical protein
MPLKLLFINWGSVFVLFSHISTSMTVLFCAIYDSSYLYIPYMLMSHDPLFSSSAKKLVN